MHLVKAAKASPHTKFYTLSTGLWVEPLEAEDLGAIARRIELDRWMKKWGRLMQISQIGTLLDLYSDPRRKLSPTIG